MAIAKVKGGSGFKGCLSYIMSKPEASHIAQGGVFGSTPEQIALEMRMNANQKNLKQPVMHASLSLVPGEIATPQQLEVLGKTWLKEMGFDLDKSQFTISRHQDKDHDHIHILANRIQLDGKVINRNFERRRSHEATRIAERTAGLSLYQQTQSTSRGMVHDLRKSVDQALSNAGSSLERFKSNIEAKGLKLVEHRSRTTGRLSGVSYEAHDGRLYKGSALGKEYSATGLQKAGLDIGYQLPGRTKANSAEPAVKSNYHLNAAQQYDGMALGTKNAAANLMKGRERLGLTQGQKDRLIKDRGHEL